MKQDKPKINVETTGHSWDGIEEWNNPLPRWWVWTFYATILWGILYTIAYPAWPLLSSATSGVLGYSTRAEVAADIAAVDAANAPMMDRIATTEMAELAAAGHELHGFAVNAGAAVFRTYCAQCHGAGGGGAFGFPNLLDDDWLWGGDAEAIAYTVRHGIHSADDEDTRGTQMPAFGEILEPEELDQVVAYVRSISGQSSDPALAEAGAEIFADNCSGCHGETGEGNRDLGAPNLTDAIWLRGGSEDEIRQTVATAKFGTMPAWGKRLTEAEVRAVATYVHQLGGGE